jgi:hypothetical protein
MVEARTRSDSPAGFSGPALRQNKRETDRPELGSAAALSVSVSRHLVSTSVQFGQSAAGKTESDQWPLAAHLLSEQLRNLRCRLSCCVGRPPPHDQGRNALLEQIWNTLLRSVLSAHRHLRNFSWRIDADYPQALKLAAKLGDLCHLLAARKL